MPPRKKKPAVVRLPKSLRATKTEQFAEIWMRLRNLEADVGLRETSPTFRALKAEIIDLRQAFLILLDRHDQHTVPMIERMRSPLIELERRLNILNEEFKAMRNGMPVSEDNTQRLVELEQRIVTLEERNPPGPSVRKRVLEAERRLDIHHNVAKQLATRMENLENSHLIAHERLDKLEDDGVRAPEEQADNSKPPIIKGGWVNVYHVDDDGLPDLTSAFMYETREEADMTANAQRIACLYLEGSGNTDEFPDPEPWVDHN